MPAGFRENYGYHVVGLFFPNGTSDPHFYVVNEHGRVVPLRCESVVLLDPNDPGYRDLSSTALLCRIPPATKGGKKRLPPGFREHVGYQILEPFFPNGSQDLHFYVVNESGSVVPLPAEHVVLIDANDPGYRNLAGGTGGVTIINNNTSTGSGNVPSGVSFAFEFPITSAARVWSKTKADLLAAYAAMSVTPVLPASFVAAHALCLNASRKAVGPHEIFFSANPADAMVTAKFTIPLTGSLSIVYRAL